MSYLVGQILVSILVAAVLGVAIGWFAAVARARSRASEIEAELQRKIARVSEERDILGREGAKATDEWERLKDKTAQERTQHESQVKLLEAEREELRRKLEAGDRELREKLKTAQARIAELEEESRTAANVHQVERSDLKREVLELKGAVQSEKEHAGGVERRLGQRVKELEAELGKSAEERASRNVVELARIRELEEELRGVKIKLAHQETTLTTRINDLESQLTRERKKSAEELNARFVKIRELEGKLIAEQKSTDHAVLKGLEQQVERSRADLQAKEKEFEQRLAGVEGLLASRRRESQATVQELVDKLAELQRKHEAALDEIDRLKAGE